MEDLVLRNKPFQWEMLFPWSVVTLMLSGPYLALLNRMHSKKERIPISGSASAIVGYCSLLLWLGWIPGQHPVQFGEAHFEVPTALFIQWFIYAFVLAAIGLSKKAP